ncbi:MAG: hypothetical protein M3083_21615 [Actinomycetota bacterium]|nr:hypothetical protein [Actinomycetota bacterium]
MRRLARGATAAALAISAAITAAPAASAWYGPAAYVTPSSATPGATVNVHGVSFDQDDPVKARLDGLDGQVLATFTPNSGEFQGPLVVPADIKRGNHVVVFMQYDDKGAIEEMPPRAMLAVTSAAGGTPLVATPVAADAGVRLADLTRSGPHTVGLGTLVLVALGAAVLCMLVAAIVVLATRRAERGVTQ